MPVTLTIDAAPHLTAAILTTIVNKTVANMTIQDLKNLNDALARFPNSTYLPTAQLGTILK
ncbi:MAG: hypothetical protein WA324_19905 [Bryobacteraceae bacterium]